MPILDLPLLLAARQQLAQPGAAPPPGRDALRGRADAALREAPPSVTHKPADLVAATGDRRDYTSMGPYWWPDPDAADGLPWIRRDGQTNPLHKDGDVTRLQRLITLVTDLALAWLYTGHEPYAEHAAACLRTWFLDPATRMNPHMRFAQSIPGRCDGRGIGLIDSRGLPEMLELLPALEHSGAWSATETDAVRDWVRELLTWMDNSKHGRDEDRHPNNHGTWYDVQVAGYALFVGDQSRARAQLERVAERRIVPHIEPDGRQPHELSRTCSLSYSVMNLVGHLNLAQLAAPLGIDLWTFRSADGRCLRAAVDFLAPYLQGGQPWPGEQIKPMGCHGPATLLRLAAIGFDEPAYLAPLTCGTPAEAQAAWHDVALRYPLPSAFDAVWAEQNSDNAAPDR